MLRGRLTFSCWRWGFRNSVPKRRCALPVPSNKLRRGTLEGFRVGAEKLYAQEHASYRGCTDKKDWAALPTRASMHWDHTRGSSSSNLFLRSDKRKRREKGRQTLGAQETNWNAGWSIPVSSVTPFDPSLTPRDRFSFFASPSFPLSIRIIR